MQISVTTQRGGTSSQRKTLKLCLEGWMEFAGREDGEGHCRHGELTFFEQTITEHLFIICQAPWVGH